MGKIAIDIGPFQSRHLEDVVSMDLRNGGILP
jgi:hypothetical protein